jgi:hypothetical protein
LLRSIPRTRLDTAASRLNGVARLKARRAPTDLVSGLDTYLCAIAHLRNGRAGAREIEIPNIASGVDAHTSRQTFIQADVGSDQGVRKAIGILVLSALLLAGCQASVQISGRPPATVDANAEVFLLEAAASDFRTHVGPNGVSFRNVHACVIRGGNGSTMNLMCGEFRTADGATDWEPFATLRTDGYENWLGASATAYCRGPNTVLDANRDLAAALGRQYHP